MDDAPPAEDLSRRSGLSILVTGDVEGVAAATAEGLDRPSLWSHPAGAQPLVSMVARFVDLSDLESLRCEIRLRREAEDQQSRRRESCRPS